MLDEDHLIGLFFTATFDTFMQPIVALESTVISHGLPYPKNLETALRLEEIVREEGGMPATVGIVGGKLIAGLKREQIEHLAQAENVRKVSRRDQYRDRSADAVDSR